MSTLLNNDSVTVSVPAQAAATSGTSVSGSSPATTAAPSGLTFNVAVDGNAAASVTIAGTNVTGSTVASALQTAIRANCTGGSAVTVTYTSVYTITSATTGTSSSIVVTGSGASTLKLGVANGGTETAGAAAVSGSYNLQVRAFKADRASVQCNTSGASSATLNLQASNDGVNWVNLSGQSVTISSSAAATNILYCDPLPYAYLNLSAAVTTGTLALTTITCVKSTTVVSN